MTERNALWVAALTSLTWGLTGIFVRLLPPLSPVTVTAGRLVIALAVVLPALLLLRGSRQGLKAAIASPAAYALALVLAGYYLLATAAFQMAPVAEVALLLSTPPLFVLAFRALRGERSARREIGGALLATGGIALILAPKIAVAGAQASGQLYGNLIALCAAALTAAYAYAYRVLAERGRAPDSGGVSLLTLALGGAVLSAATAFAPAPSGLAQLGGAALLLLLGLGVVSTAVPTLGFAIASKRLPALVTATISLFIPLFAALFGFLILGEGLSLLFVAGSLVVLAGVALIVRPGRGEASG